MHNNKTTSLKVNENTDVFTTPNKSFNEIHLRKKVPAVHWSTYDKGVINIEVQKCHDRESIEIDITETNIESGHEKRVMLNLKGDELQALKDALNSL